MTWIDPIRAFAELACSMPNDAVPEHVLTFQKKRILDNMAVAAAGRHADGLSQLDELFSSQGTSSQVLLVGTDRKASLLDACFYNSVAARALDFCDVAFSGQHPSSTDVQVALAVGSVTRSSGADILSAMAVGQDMADRLYSAVDPDNEFHGFDSNILSCFSASLIAGRLMKLTVDQQQDAFGLALNRMAGTFQNNRDGSLAVRLVQGFSSRAGVEAALLARAGLTGPRRSLCGVGGFFDLYARRRDIDPTSLTDGLGVRFFGGQDRTCFKLYPSCSATLSLTDAALEIVRMVPFDLEDIAKVSLDITPVQDALCGAPFEPGDSPAAAAMFSVHYVTANALVRKSSRLEHFTADSILDPDLLALAKAVNVRVVPANLFDACAVAVDLKDGRRLAASAKNGKGWPANPLSDSDFILKVEQCMEFAGYLDFAERADRIHSVAADMNEIDDVSIVLDMLKPAGAS
ncbi:MAG: MmgE/PrpD family protein [Pseudomonadota bacterium]